MAVIGWSGMLWYWIVGVPLVVASIMGTAKPYAVPKLCRRKDLNCSGNYGKYVQIYYYFTFINFSVSLNL